MTTRPAAAHDHDHLTWAEARYVLGRTEHAVERKPLYYTLALCEGCRRGTGALFELYRNRLVFLDTSLGEVESVLEEHAAPEVWARIEAETLGDERQVDQMLRKLQDDDRWPSWGLVSWHARCSEEAARDDPQEALRRAKLAAAGAAELPAEEPGQEFWNAELQAFAEAALGNAHRVAGELGKAQAAFERAHEHLAAYPDEPAWFLAYRPRVYDLESSLHRAQRNYKAAFEALDSAYEAWDRADRVRPEDRARVLLKKANLLDEIDDLEGALAQHERAAALLGPEADDAFRLAVDNNLVFYLVRLGRLDEAAERMPALKELAEAVGAELDTLRVRWVEARLCEARGKPERAEALYREVLDGFCQHGLGYDGALTAMDLARLLYGQGRTDEVKEMALAVKPIFEALGVEAEAHRALRAFLAAHRQDEHAALGVGLVAEVWWKQQGRR